MKTRIFVTGATGFIGKHLVNALISKNKDIICLVRKKQQEGMFKKSRHLKFIFGSLPSIKEISKEIGPADIVVHLANISDGKKEDFYRINVEGTKNLVSLCEKIKIKKFIFLSSTVVLNSFKSPYTETKRLAESIVKNSKLNFVILRPDMVYGMGSKRHILDIADNIKNKGVQVIFGYGHIKIQPVHINDVVNAIARAIESSGNERGVYNIASEKPVTYEQLFKLIKKITKGRCIIISIPKFIALPIVKMYSMANKNSTLYRWIRGNEKVGAYDISNAKRDLGFSPIQIEKGLPMLIKS